MKSNVCEYCGAKASHLIQINASADEQRTGFPAVRKVCVACHDTQTERPM